MLARVTIFEGGTPDGIRAWSEQVSSNARQGPPPGVKSAGLTMLTDADDGRVMMIGLFQNESDLRESEQALRAMDLPDGIGSRKSTDVYEVGTEVRN